MDTLLFHIRLLCPVPSLEHKGSQRSVIKNPAAQAIFQMVQDQACKGERAGAEGLIA